MSIIGEDGEGLSRLNFAWEILRQIPAYRTAQNKTSEVTTQGCCDCCSGSRQWGLLKFCRAGAGL